MLEVCCFKWKPAFFNYRSKFTAQTVNVLARMVARNYKQPHRFNCITDDPKGIDKTIRVIPLWKDHSSLSSLHGRHQPSCYRRLKLFSAEAKELIGERIVALDLDVVITGDLVPLWDRPEDFVIMKSPSGPAFYNGSMFMVKAGTRTQLWDDFHPNKSPLRAKQAGQFGSDQAWIGYKLGNNEATWDTSDGVYSYRIHIAPKPQQLLPPNAKVVVFHGADDPWEPKAQSLKWVRDNWR